MLELTFFKSLKSLAKLVTKSTEFINFEGKCQQKVEDAMHAQDLFQSEP